MPRHNQHPEDVKAKVRKRYGTLAALAVDAKISDSAVRKSLYEPVPSGNRTVAAALDTTVHALWPEWYDAQGNRIDAQGNRVLPRNTGKTSSRRHRGHCQNERAA